MVDGRYTRYPPEWLNLGLVQGLSGWRYWADVALCIGRRNDCSVEPRPPSL
jgi:hypothetical protein